MFETDRVYIVGIEDNYSDYPLVVFPDEKSTIAFLNNHTPADYTANRADFTLHIYPFGDPNGYYDASPELESAVYAANDR